ncbi:calponin-like domain-containing protein [Phthorimaea operculella]|nr:calponin-like domain-containing protein [Phthorimaea operculella]
MESADRCAGKREPEKDLEAQQWIEAVIGERFPPGMPYEHALRDGIILCKLMNRLQPGIIQKVNVSGGDYKFMDNISQDGIILCKLMNRLQPGIIQKVNVSGGDYKFMDNISQFQKACIKYGVPDTDLFQTTDLWDQKNIALVTNTIFAVGRTAYKHPEWRGPWLGPRPAEENRREFSEDVLRAGESVIGLQAGTNKLASQSGQNFGASRKIILGK